MNGSTRGFSFKNMVVGVLVSLAALLVAGQVRPVAADAAHGHPARVQEGTCDALGPVAFPLNGAGATLTIDGSTPEPLLVGSSTAVGVELSVTTIEAQMAEFAMSTHAIVVYLSDEAMETVIACGEVGGPMLGDALVVGLRTVGESGSAGMALLEPTDAGVSVTILLGDGITGESGDDHAGDDHGHDEGTPES